MDCKEVAAQLDAYHDDELDAVGRAALDHHIASCPACASALAEIAWISAKVAAAATVPVPAGLRHRIDLALAVRPAADDVGPRKRAWLSHGLVGGLAAAAGLALGLIWPAGPAEDAVTRDAVAAHVRSLIDDRLVTLPSSDPHVIRPWFAGKIAAAPRIPDLSDDGFPLLGGRLDFLDDRSAMVVVYGVRRHRINVFIRPADRSSPLDGTRRPGSRLGYQVVHWRSGDLDLVAVSDIDGDELARFAYRLRVAMAAQSP